MDIENDECEKRKKVVVEEWKHAEGWTWRSMVHIVYVGVSACVLSAQCSHISIAERTFLRAHALALEPEPMRKEIQINREINKMLEFN